LVRRILPSTPTLSSV